MLLALARSWWSVTIRGLIAILFGILTIASPGITLAVLVLLFGAYALVDGIINLAGAWRASQAHERWAPLLLEGVAGILAGIATIAWPGITLAVLIYLIAAWAIITGVMEIAAAIRLRRYIAGEWLLALGGAISILFGIFVAMMPVLGALAIAFWLGAYALIFGVVLVALGLRLRSRRRMPHVLVPGTGAHA